MSRPKVGFAGVGWIGRNRLEAAAATGEIEVAALADPSPENLEAAGTIVPGAQRTESFEQLLSLDLDGMVIATPNGQHAEQAIAALEAGLAVFCQKPVGRSGREVEAVVTAARKANRLLAADLSYRHTAAFGALSGLVSRRALGALYAARFVFHNAYGPDKPWFYDPRLSGGGCLIDLGTHLVDLALWLMPQARVTGVECRAFRQGARLEGGVEDFVTAQLELSDGASVEVACSWRLHAGKEAVIEADLFGTEGGASVRNVAGSFYDFTAHCHRGTQTQQLCGPPDAWAGRAIAGWAAQLAQGRRFDAGCAGLVQVSEVIDALYARCGR